MKKALLSGILFALLTQMLLAQEGIPNGDFEEWVVDSVGVEDPVGWDTPNSTTAPFSVFTVTRSDSSAHATSSVLLESKLIASIVVPGVITLGQINFDLFNDTAYINGGIPFTERPEALKGSFKNFPAPGDSTLIGIVFTEYLEAKGKRDTVGVGFMYTADIIENWTTFTIPVNYRTDNDPDTINIFAISSNMSAPDKDSYMFVDNLMLDDGSGFGEFRIIKTQIFPNPASEEITFTFEKKLSGSIMIFSGIGQLLTKKDINSTIVTINISALSPGMYYFGIFAEKYKISSGKFIVTKD